MSSEIHFDGIPEKYQKLFLGSAREVLKAALELINNCETLEEQQDNLDNPIFHNALVSAFVNLDQRRGLEIINFVAQLPKELQAQATSDFLGENN